MIDKERWIELMETNDWRRWLSDEELSELEADHDGQEYLGLYESAMKTVAYERERLAKARGMLYSVKFGDYTDEELDSILKETEGF